ncbi:MAG TPA: hypothetical protein VK604_03115 [Bryobacteraceae bacterium]|nr:hypothetical protein [Bryobacteraceae bacterium]
MTRATLLLFIAALLPPRFIVLSRIAKYWLLPPETHQFRISHDFKVTRTGQSSVHSFVRKGSIVTTSEIYNLDTGEKLPTHQVAGKSVNALGYYLSPTADDSVVVQGDLPHPLAAGESVRVRVVETYTDPQSYKFTNGELKWDRTLGRPRNMVKLPAGWFLTEVTPAGHHLPRRRRPCHLPLQQSAKRRNSRPSKSQAPLRACSPPNSLETGL